MPLVQQLSGIKAEFMRVSWLMAPRWPHNSKDHVHIPTAGKRAVRNRKIGLLGEPGPLKELYSYSHGELPLHLNNQIHLQEKTDMKIQTGH